MSDFPGSRPVKILILALVFAVLTVPLPSMAQEQVTNPAKAPNGQETIELKELWRVGGYDDEEVLFGVITDIIAGPNGNFYMLDSQLNEVQVYSPDGAYQRTIGREGEGPGEFRMAFNIVLLPNGNIGVLQAFPSKIVTLTPGGIPLMTFSWRQVKMKPASRCCSWRGTRVTNWPSSTLSPNRQRVASLNGAWRLCSTPTVATSGSSTARTRR